MQQNSAQNQIMSGRVKELEKKLVKKDELLKKQQEQAQKQMMMQMQGMTSSANSAVTSMSKKLNGAPNMNNKWAQQPKEENKVSKPVAQQQPSTLETM